MEEIFNKLVENSKKTEAQKLRNEGFSYSQIGEKLGVSKQYIAKLLSQPTVNQPSTKTPDSSTKTSTNRQPEGQPFNQEQINYLKKTFCTVEEMRSCLAEFEGNLLEKVQTAIEQRIEKTIKYYTVNTLNSLVERGIIDQNVVHSSSNKPGGFKV